MLFTSRSIANGNLLRRFLNKKVNIMVNVENIDSSGKILTGKTTDNQTIQICLPDPVTSPVNGWIEVIGVPTGSDRVNCEEVSNATLCLISVLKSKCALRRHLNKRKHIINVCVINLKNSKFHFF